MHEALKLLEETREALVAGRFDQLTHLVPATDTALSRLSHASAEELAVIRAHATRNQSLIRAAQAGMRAAAPASREFGTYGTDGRRIAEATGPAVERKA